MFYQICYSMVPVLANFPKETVKEFTVINCSPQQKVFCLLQYKRFAGTKQFYDTELSGNAGGVGETEMYPYVSFSISIDGWWLRHCGALGHDNMQIFGFLGSSRSPLEILYWHKMTYTCLCKGLCWWTWFTKLNCNAEPVEKWAETDFWMWFSQGSSNKGSSNKGCHADSWSIWYFRTLPCNCAVAMTSLSVLSLFWYNVPFASGEALPNPPPPGKSSSNAFESWLSNYIVALNFLLVHSAAICCSIESQEQVGVLTNTTLGLWSAIYEITGCRVLIY